MLFFLISSACPPIAFKGTHIEDVGDDFNPIEEIDDVQVISTDFRFGSHWISNFTVVLETKDGSRSFVQANPGERLLLNYRDKVKLVPEKAN